MAVWTNYLAVQATKSDRGERIQAITVDLPEGRRMLAVERTYREGVCIILDPTPEELSVAREGDLWKLWNSERAQDLYAIE